MSVTHFSRIQVNIEQPILMANKYLDKWLKREGIILPEKKKKRIAALIARYFHNEDKVTGDLIFNFLDNHYTGHRDIDLDDIRVVKYEIQRLLNDTIVQNKDVGRKFWLDQVVTSVILSTLIAISLHFVPTL